MNDQTGNPAEAFLGKVRKAKATGGHQVDPNQLLPKLEGTASVVRSFCTGCGNYLELSQVKAEKLATSAKITLPPNLEGWYFETESCRLCDGKGDGVFLKSLQ